MTVYLSEGNQHVAVEAALDGVAAAFDLEIVRRLPPVIGSWFRRFKARTGRPETARTLQTRLAKVERALELQVLDRPQAEIDSAQADAVAKLLLALSSTPSALVQIGSVLLIKVDGVPVVRNLTHSELAHLARNPMLLKDPAAVLRGLQDTERQMEPTRDAGTIDHSAGHG
jgi:hypothetical protein